LLFSATYDNKIQSLSLDYLIDPIQIQVGDKNTANEDIKQEVFVVEKIESKMEWLLDSINKMVENGKILIFCNHIKTCNDLGTVLSEFAPQINKVVIHGDKIQ
jgi:superfamily II DNA/RNA helicase